MRPNGTASHQGSRTSLTMLAVGAVFLLMGVTAAHAGPDAPTLTVIGGTGIPGGTVNVTFALSNDVSDPNVAACAAEIELDFDDALLDFPGPPGGARPPRCNVDQRLSSSHVIQGPGQIEPGVLDAEVFANPAGQNSPIGNGNIATCAFNVDIGAPVGTTALVLDTVQSSLKRCNGSTIMPVNFVNGEVVIALPTPTFTTTRTPTVIATNTRTVAISPTATRTVSATSTSTSGTVSPTSTATGGSPTRTVTATNTSGTPGTPTATRTGPTSTSTVATTPINTATRTSGGGGTPTRTPQRSTEDDGCNIAAPAQASSGGAAVLVLVPALLLWMRRRRF